MKHVGVIGMSVMGSNLAINIAKNGYYVSIFNRTSKKTDKVIFNNPKIKLIPFYDIKLFIKSIKPPRCIFLVIQTGPSIDEIINLIKPILNNGDIIIDFGNSFFKDTIKRYKQLKKEGLNFIGAGISGGKYGALYGPAIMPGCNKHVYKMVEEIFTKISAKNYDNEPCVKYIGPNGSGHYVKMIHNGIEYSNMQLIAESYFILKNMLNINNQKLSFIFNNWNIGELNSYLMEITKNIFIKLDDNNSYLIDNILDIADNKGTGKLSVINSLEINEPSNIVASAVFSRFLSFMKTERILSSKILTGPKVVNIKDNKKLIIEKIRKSLFFCIIISYTQGFSQLRSASNKYNWNLNYENIAKIFRQGCIIKAKLLEYVVCAYHENKNLYNLLLSPYFNNIANNYNQSLRDIISLSVQNGIPIPAFSSAISYYDSYRSSVLPANLIQAQRDYFGAHKYKRIDKDGIFHTEKWIN